VPRAGALIPAAPLPRPVVTRTAVAVVNGSGVHGLVLVDVELAVRLIHTASVPGCERLYKVYLEYRRALTRGLSDVSQTAVCATLAASSQRDASAQVVM